MIEFGCSAFEALRAIICNLKFSKSKILDFVVLLKFLEIDFCKVFLDLLVQLYKSNDKN